jgi:hypothetical protein
MSSPKTPPPPDPIATASAQAGANRDTAVTQGLMNMVNQVGPDGSLTYDKIGDETLTDSLTGKTYTIPRYQATQTLSAAGQRLQGINNQTQENIATIGRDQSARIGELLGKPVNINNEATEARLMDLGSKRLDPRFARDEEALRTRLVNQGIRPGTAAFDAEMSNFNQGKNDAVNQLLLTGRQQAVQEALTERNQPINEITALLSGSQVAQPNFINTPQTQVAGTDYQGAVYASHNAAMQNAQMKQQSQNALMGGLFGLAGTIGKAALPMISDRRAKTDISSVGKLHNGLTVYRYRYKSGGPYMIGLMADEVAEIHPEAVERLPIGLDAVHYDLAVQ